MNFNFESCAEDLIVKFDKKLVGHENLVMKQMGVLFDFLGDRLPYEARKQLEQVVGDIVSDGNKSQSALFQSTMNKVLRAVREVVKE